MKVDRRDFVVTVPGRLRPYLTDMLNGGLWGTHLEQTVIYALQTQIQEEVRKGAIPNRINGRIARRPA